MREWVPVGSLGRSHLSDERLLPNRRALLATGAHACTAVLAAAALPFPLAAEGDRQRFMLIGLTGPEQPSRVSLLFAWANALADAGHTVRLDLAGDATVVIRSAVSDSLSAPGLPPFKDIIARTQDRGVPIFVCRPCAEARGVTDADLESRHAQYTNGPAMAAAMEWAGKVFTV